MSAHVVPSDKTMQIFANEVCNYAKFAPISRSLGLSVMHPRDNGVAQQVRKLTYYESFGDEDEQRT